MCSSQTWGLWFCVSLLYFKVMSRYVMSWTQIFGTPTCVFMAVYIPGFCKPCLIWERFMNFYISFLSSSQHLIWWFSNLPFVVPDDEWYFLANILTAFFPWYYIAHLLHMNTIELNKFHKSTESIGVCM